jgi:hypothetical protein
VAERADTKRRGSARASEATAPKAIKMATDFAVASCKKARRWREAVRVQSAHRCSTELLSLDSSSFARQRPLIDTPAEC